MQVLRVGPQPDRAIEAAAAFYANVLPDILAGLDPARNGEGTRAQHGGGAPSAERDSAPPPVPLHQPAAGPPPRSGEDLVLVFPPASHDHRGWRLAAVQDLARLAAPRRVNAIAGDDEGAIAATLAWLDQAPGVTGQLLSVGTG